jgi:hypothetical protein
LDARSLQVSSPELDREIVWYCSTELLQRGAYYVTPLLVAEVESVLQRADNDTRLSFRSGDIIVGSLRQKLKDHLRDHGPQIKPVHPVRDLSGPGGWIWSNYSDNQLLLRTRSVYGAGIKIYQALVQQWFAPLSKRLNHYVLMPFRFEGDLHPGDPNAKGIEGSPSLVRRYHPLPSGSKPDVDIQLRTNRVQFPSHDWKGQLATLRSMRPDAPEKAGLGVGVGILDIFHAYPARELAYRWLSDDLQQIGWIDGHLSKWY